MRNEFESDLAKSVAEKGQKTVRGKAWLVMVLGAALLVSGFAAVAAVSADDMDKTQTKDQLKDGSCEDGEDCVPINDGEDCVPINDGEDCVPINDGEDCVPINESG